MTAAYNNFMIILLVTTCSSALLRWLSTEHLL